MRIIEVYTDGACTQGAFMPWPGGYAVYAILSDRDPIIIDGGKLHTTNNEMELTAFLKALELVDFQCFMKKYDAVNIYTDSAYIHNCFEQKWYEKWLKNNWISSSKEEVKNKELWIKILNAFDKVKKQTELKIQKVAAHSTDRYNNLVDELAVKAKEKVVKENENNSYIR
jgi:ribonuclease HI